MSVRASGSRTVAGLPAFGRSAIMAIRRMVFSQLRLCQRRA